MNLMRNVAVAGLIWSVVWVALAMIAGTAIQLFDPADIDQGEEPIVIAPMVALAGFICGAVFAAIVTLLERRPNPPRARIVMWGVAVGAALPLVLGHGVPELVITAVVGALSALISTAPRLTRS